MSLEFGRPTRSTHLLQRRGSSRVWEDFLPETEIRFRERSREGIAKPKEELVGEQDRKSALRSLRNLLLDKEERLL